MPKSHEQKYFPADLYEALDVRNYWANEVLKKSGFVYPKGREEVFYHYYPDEEAVEAVDLYYVFGYLPINKGKNIEYKPCFITIDDEIDSKSISVSVPLEIGDLNLSFLRFREMGIRDFKAWNDKNNKRNDWRVRIGQNSFEPNVKIDTNPLNFDDYNGLEGAFLSFELSSREEMTNRNLNQAFAGVLEAMKRTWEGANTYFKWFNKDGIKNLETQSEEALRQPPSNLISLFIRNKILIDKTEGKTYWERGYKEIFPSICVASMAFREYPKVEFRVVQNYSPDPSEGYSIWVEIYDPFFTINGEPYDFFRQQSNN